MSGIFTSNVEEPLYFRWRIKCAGTVNVLRVNRLCRFPALCQDLMERILWMPKIPEKIEKEDGSIEWRLDGNLHREDGPAVERPEGTRVWFRHGKQHREDGPAVEHGDGTKEWWRNGQLQ